MYILNINICYLSNNLNSYVSFLLLALTSRYKSLHEISYIFPNGDKYGDLGECCRTSDGVMRKGLAHRHQLLELLTLQNGTMIRCVWDMNGRGTLTHPSGAFYSDQFRDNMHHVLQTYAKVHRLVWTGMFHNKVALGLKLKVNM
uniref:Uncharacterized protein n=1 Tax=Sinocyclocheilus grahami TaxID=75366 RepID=A0A672P3Q0_SINGR